ncbi:uncharacterized protein LOC120014919 [Tripterygium wilfordii]|nr:uncharacterized protein LOC120014919 [Tripterygium wilfordii]XP_038722972.1 uncharacterized protein LOC120014919 [Tripterygium wilfordii]XP_038722973.1 uncharacterized protein LOC120014919 [Tripterygium wilfordii]
MKRDRQSQCGGCRAEERFLLHNIRHLGTYRRLCTGCVLKTHQGLFCPFCLQLFEDARPPPSDQRLMCFNCPSISHLSCAPSSAHSSSFLCPTCSDPSSSFFNSSSPESGRLIHRESARALVAAARIAAAAMTKAAVIARVEAERRAKEAISAKKRAKEALEQLTRLAPKEKDMEKRNYTGLHNNNKKKLKSR